MAVIFKRDYDIYISKAPDGSANSTNTVRLNVKDFSWNQRNSTVDQGRDTLDPTQERTVAPYIRSVAPVNFEFTTYMLPVLDTNVTSPEEYLWASLMGVDSFTSTPTSSTIDFANGNVSTLQNLTLWFVNPKTAEGEFRINNAVIDRATIEFDINGIAEIRWEGRALSIVFDFSAPAATNRTTADNFIKNKPSTLEVTLFSTLYNLALTGGRIVFDNKNTYYGRNKLGKTTVPVGHYTGNRTITGNLEVYLKTGNNAATDLLNLIYIQIDNDTYEQDAETEIIINIGGTTGPRVRIDIPVAILDIPRVNFREALTMNIEFSAKESTGNYSSVIYYV